MGKGAPASRRGRECIGGSCRRRAGASASFSRSPSPIVCEDYALNWNRFFATRTNSGMDRSTAPTTVAGLDIWNIWSSSGRDARTSSALISFCPELASPKAPERTISFRSEAPSRFWTVAELFFWRANKSLLPSLAVRSFTPAARAAYPSFDLSAGIVSPGSSTRAFAWPGFKDSIALMSFRVSADLARPGRVNLRNAPISASTILSAKSIPLFALGTVKALLVSCTQLMPHLIHKT